MKERKINIMDFVNDKFISEAAPMYIFDKQSKQKNRITKIFIKFMVTYTAFVFIIFAVINIYRPIYARTIPFLGSTFALIQDKLDFTGIYSNYAFEIGDNAIDNGITVTLSEVYCDGINLYASFIVKSEQAFSKLSSDYIKDQLYYEGTAYIIDKSNRMKLNDFGVVGLEGEFLDNYTFAGIETFSLNGSNFPNEFTFEMKVHSIGVMGSDDGIDYKTIHGNWIFSTLVKSNTNDVLTYEINKEVNGHTIDKVVVTPVMITVFTSYPDIYSGTTRYQVNTYNEISSDIDISVQGRYSATNGITQIPRNRVNNKLYIYVLDREQLCKTGKERGKRKEIEEHTIVWTEISIK